MKISSPRHLMRRDRLERLVAEWGGASKLAKDAHTPKTHISAMLAGNRGLGDRLAAKLERVTGRPGWFDGVESAMPFRDLRPMEALLVTYFRELPPERQQSLVLEARESPPANVVPLPTASPSVRPGVLKTAKQKGRSPAHKKKGA